MNAFAVVIALSTLLSLKAVPVFPADPAVRLFKTILSGICIGLGAWLLAFGVGASGRFDEALPLLGVGIVAPFWVVAGALGRRVSGKENAVAGFVLSVYFLQTPGFSFFQALLAGAGMGAGVFLIEGLRFRALFSSFPVRGISAVLLFAGLTALVFSFLQG